MLELIRKGASTWVARILLGILALSFVYWGADVRSGRSNSDVIATVGETPITQGELDRALENEIALLSQRAGRRLTQTEALQFGLDRRALENLISRAAIDRKAVDLGLAISEKTAAESLLRDPSFKGFDGRFDRQGFDALLRQIGMREREFIDLRRREEARLQLTESVVRATVTPDPLVKTMHDWREETRVIEYFKIESDKAVTVPDPDSAKLKEVYEANKTKFMAPEYRQLQILLASVDKLKSAIDIPDDAIAKAYEETKDVYATPELRRIQQIPFKSKAEAEAAKAAIKAGKNFMTVAEELKLKDTDLDLGLVNKKGLLDSKIADAAFSLERNAVSDVVEGRLVTVLLRVPEIVPGKQPTLEEVKPKVRDKLQVEKARDEVKKLREEIEDLRLAGKSLKEIAELKKLQLIDVAATDAGNKDKDGKPAFDHPDSAALIGAGFDDKTSTDREAIDIADGGYGWVTTLSTTPARQKAFDEVEAEVKAYHLTSERERLMRELAQKLVDRVNAGESMEKLAGEFATKAEATAAITRVTVPQGLTEVAVKQGFALPVGRAGHTESDDRKGRTVLRLAEVRPAPAPSKEQLAALSLELERQLQNDILDAFVNGLREGAGVTINEAVLRRNRAATQ